jgi:hypothetical protein
MSWRAYRIAPLAVLAAAFIWWSCGEEKEAPVGPSDDAVTSLELTPQFSSVRTGKGPTGAIFTTTPDGGEVNENVHYGAKIEVYLDGGPPPNAPVDAAGLDAGWYVFQVTNPSGWVLLSQSPAKCRVVEVSEDGVIVRRVPVGELGLSDGYEQPEPGKPNGNNGTPIPNCHVDDDPPHPTDPGVAGTSGHHDTNVDLDHGDDFGAIVVQLMPFLDTPNPGGVYKAWMIPIERYEANGGDLEDVPGDKNNEIVKKKGQFQGYVNDPGFGPPRDQSKTDNFKVREVPPWLYIFKFEDLDGDGVKDEGEPEITGWTVYYREIYDGDNHEWQTCNTPCSLKFAPGTTVEVSEDLPAGWAVTYANLDGQDQGATTDVTVVFEPGDMTHTLEYGNFELVDVTACKYEDLDGDGDQDNAIAGWTVHLTVDGEIEETELTGTDGCYTWSDLGPLPDGSYYDASETVPAGWTATSPTEVDFESPPQSGASYQAEFTNFQNVEVKACKYEDLDGDGDQDNAIAGWTVHLTIDGEIEDTQTTGEDGCYTWTDLDPLDEGSYYDASEEVPAGWTATSPTEVDFESPPQSGASYQADFTNFENVEVTACKVKDADGDPGTTNDQEPAAGWTVYLTIDGEIEDTQTTGADGCYTWTDLGPLAAGSYYDVEEATVMGWSPLTPTAWDFESPPQSGASYSYTFINTPTQGCTPGYWKVQQHWDSWLSYSPGDALADVFELPYWVASTVVKLDQSDSSDPTDEIAIGDATLSQALRFNGSGAAGLLRAAVAALLNGANSDVAYFYTDAEVIGLVNAALAAGEPDIGNLAGDLDNLNNGPGGCPLN